MSVIEKAREALEQNRLLLQQDANANPDNKIPAIDLIDFIRKSRHGPMSFGSIGGRFAQDYCDIAEVLLSELIATVEAQEIKP